MCTSSARCCGPSGGCEARRPGSGATGADTNDADALPSRRAVSRQLVEPGVATAHRGGGHLGPDFPAEPQAAVELVAAGQHITDVEPGSTPSTCASSSKPRMDPVRTLRAKVDETGPGGRLGSRTPMGPKVKPRSAASQRLSTDSAVARCSSDRMAPPFKLATGILSASASRRAHSMSTVLPFPLGSYRMMSLAGAVRWARPQGIPGSTLAPTPGPPDRAEASRSQAGTDWPPLPIRAGARESLPWQPHTRPSRCAVAGRWRGDGPSPPLGFR